MHIEPKALARRKPTFHINQSHSAKKRNETKRYKELGLNASARKIQILFYFSAHNLQIKNFHVKLTGNIHMHNFIIYVCTLLLSFFSERNCSVLHC